MSLSLKQSTSQGMIDFEITTFATFVQKEHLTHATAHDDAGTLRYREYHLQRPYPTSPTSPVLVTCGQAANQKATRTLPQLPPTYSKSANEPSKYDDQRERGCPKRATVPHAPRLERHEHCSHEYWQRSCTSSACRYKFCLMWLERAKQRP